MYAIIALLCGLISAWHLARGETAFATVFILLSFINLACLYVDEAPKNSGVNSDSQDWPS